jgi:hypothetical protein
MRVRPALLAVPIAIGVLALGCARPPAAQAFDPTKSICTLAGLVSTLAGKVCSTARHAGTVLKAGQKLLKGHVGGAVETITGSGGSPSRATTTAVALVAATAWVLAGAHFVLHETASVISGTSRPELRSTWFSATYWRVAAISALLTLPFLFAAAIQALLRSDLTLLLRAAFGYLPLGFLGVAVAAPLTQLLLSASDEMSNLVASASGFTAAGFSHFTGSALAISGLGASAFPIAFVGLLTVAGALTLWIELLVRAAAVYVIVLLLPLFFAALVWPARRVWALRIVELLFALILSKFAIVAVLALGAAALGQMTVPHPTQMLAGTTLVLLAAFTPWGLMRLLPLHELAAGVDGLRGGGTRWFGGAEAGAEGATAGRDQASTDEGLGPVDDRPLPATAAGDERGAAQAALDNLGGSASGHAGGGASNGATPDAAVTATPSRASANSATGAISAIGGTDSIADDDSTPPSTSTEAAPWAEGMQAPFQGADGSWPITELGPGMLEQPPAEPVRDVGVQDDAGPAIEPPPIADDQRPKPQPRDPGKEPD